MTQPSFGEVWDVDLDPVRGHEQAGRRPALIVSMDRFNESPAGLVVVLLITRADRQVRWHVRIEPPEGGLTAVSFVMCEAVRSISTVRLLKKRGRVAAATQGAIEDRMRILLGL